MAVELRELGTEPFLYVQGASGCAAFGSDGTDGEKIKLVTGLAVTDLDPSSGNPQTLGSIALTIDPSTNGDITLSPKGSGQTTLFNGSLEIQANNAVPTPGAGVGNLIMASTSTGGDAGVILLGGEGTPYRFIHNYGTGSTFIGKNAGNTSSSTFFNTAIGNTALQALTGGAGNTAIGNAAGLAMQNSTDNVAIGSGALAHEVAGNDNTAVGTGALAVSNGANSNTCIGFGSLPNLINGTRNIAIGFSSGTLYSTNEANNILIGNSGAGAESNVIRIGTSGSGVGEQNKCFMAGVNGVSVTAAGTVVIDASGQLGTSANLPIAVPVTVPNGGTGRTTLTNHGVLVGAGTSAITQLTAGTNGQVLLGSTGADPVFATLTSTGGTITYTTGAGTLNLETAGTPGITWSVITADQTAAVNNGYICNKGSALLLALPTTSAAGTIVRVTGINTALGWKITQAAGQQIFFGATSTTSGATGFLQSTATRDSVELVCVVADLTWNVISSVGNITVS